MGKARKVALRVTAKKNKRKRGPPELIPHPVSRPDSARLGRAKVAAKLSRITVPVSIVAYVDASPPRASAPRLEEQ